MLLTFFLSFCMLSCSNSIFATPNTFNANVPYGPLPGEILDLCQPLTPPPAAGFPGLILLHGGGWVLGNQHLNDSTCKYMASLGFVTVAVNYRLAPAYHWPAQLEDVQLAVRWLRSHAHLFALDTHRLCSYGTSAGGHLALFLGELSTIHPGDAAALLPQESPQTTCVVDQFGPTDLVTFPQTAYQKQITLALLGHVTHQKLLASERDASPLYAISSHAAPTLILQGSTDTIVPPYQSRELQRKLLQAGVPVCYISYIGGHSLLGVTNKQKAILQQELVNYLLRQNGLG
ncbi:MAG TPA: alpha/beta hydrolase [Ktedonobacteraceae bacterium]|nr:alpha/beta hydrolase [Ktedonobacteraceae bacterium]